MRAIPEFGRRCHYCSSGQSSRYIVVWKLENCLIEAVILKPANSPARALRGAAALLGLAPARFGGYAQPVQADRGVVDLGRSFSRSDAAVAS